MAKRTKLEKIQAMVCGPAKKKAAPKKAKKAKRKSSPEAKAKRAAAKAARLEKKLADQYGASTAPEREVRSFEGLKKRKHRK